MYSFETSGKDSYESKKYFPYPDYAIRNNDDRVLPICVTSGKSFNCAVCLQRKYLMKKYKGYVLNH